MKIKSSIVLLLLGLLIACAPTNSVGEKDKNNNTKTSINEPLKSLIGKRITVKGKTVNLKGGAALILENGTQIWMDDMESWPLGYFINEQDTKIVKVSGILIERNDLPVFIYKDNDSLIQQGIPMPEGTDLNKASHRFVFEKYEWVVVE
jgi:hypothetical protein